MKFPFIFRKKIKAARYFIETILVKFALWFFGRMSVQNASDFAAKIAKFIGKRIAVHRLAHRNLSKAMPQLQEAQKNEILENMWDNLGRIVGEFVHVCKYQIDEIENFIEVSNYTREVLAELKNNKKGGIIFSGHFGNWEMGPKFFLKNGLNVNTVYRPLNNLAVEKITAEMRGINLIEKGTNGNRKIIEVIKNGDFVIILADQKITGGEPIKFFHDAAITTTTIARIALKYDVPLIPACCVRLEKKFRFYAHVEKPLVIKKTGDVNFDSLQLTRQINQKLEEWISKNPSQWFWVHNRWKL